MTVLEDELKVSGLFLCSSFTTACFTSDRRQSTGTENATRNRRTASNGVWSVFVNCEGRFSITACLMFSYSQYHHENISV